MALNNSSLLLDGEQVESCSDDVPSCTEAVTSPSTLPPARRSSTKRRSSTLSRDTIGSAPSAGKITFNLQRFILAVSTEVLCEGEGWARVPSNRTPTVARYRRNTDKPSLRLAPVRPYPYASTVSRICDKRQMYLSMAQAGFQRFVPQTFTSVPNFVAAFEAGRAEDGLWFVKGADGHMGRDVRPFVSAKEAAAYARTVANGNNSFVIQRGVPNLMLHEGRKFVIRTMVAIDSYARVFLHREGIVVVHEQQYDEADDDKFIHVLHTRGCLRAPWSSFADFYERSFDAIKDLTAATAACISDRLQRAVANGLVGGGGVLPPNDGDPTSPGLASPSIGRFYALLGYDIVLDTQYRPHLLEVNEFPQLGFPGQEPVHSAMCEMMREFLRHFIVPAAKQVHGGGRAAMNDGTAPKPPSPKCTSQSTNDFSTPKTKGRRGSSRQRAGLKEARCSTEARPHRTDATVQLDGWVQVDPASASSDEPYRILLVDPEPEKSCGSTVAVEAACRDAFPTKPVTIMTAATALDFASEAEEAADPSYHLALYIERGTPAAACTLFNLMRHVVRTDPSVGRVVPLLGIGIDPTAAAAAEGADVLSAVTCPLPKGVPPKLLGRVIRFYLGIPEHPEHSTDQVVARGQGTGEIPAELRLALEAFNVRRQQRQRKHRGAGIESAGSVQLPAVLGSPSPYAVRVSARSPTKKEHAGNPDGKPWTAAYAPTGCNPAGVKSRVYGYLLDDTDDEGGGSSLGLGLQGALEGALARRRAQRAHGSSQAVVCQDEGLSSSDPSSSNDATNPSYCIGRGLTKGEGQYRVVHKHREGTKNSRVVSIKDNTKPTVGEKTEPEGGKKGADGGIRWVKDAAEAAHLPFLRRTQTMQHASHHNSRVGSYKTPRREDRGSVSRGTPPPHPALPTMSGPPTLNTPPSAPAVDGSTSLASTVAAVASVPQSLHSPRVGGCLPPQAGKFLSSSVFGATPTAAGEARQEWPSQVSVSRFTTIYRPTHDAAPGLITRGVSTPLSQHRPTGRYGAAAYSNNSNWGAPMGLPSNNDRRQLLSDLKASLTHSKHLVENVLKKVDNRIK